MTQVASSSICQLIDRVADHTYRVLEPNQKRTKLAN
jgi:hypothetical protein